MNRNPEADILITGNCDLRGSEKYNQKLGRARADTVKKFMLGNGIPEERIRIISRGKLDAIAHITDLVGMQKDRNAQFMVAEVEEIMLPAPDVAARQQAGTVQQVDEGKYIMEKEEDVTSEVQVSTKEYVVQKGDTLSGIAKKMLGALTVGSTCTRLTRNGLKTRINLKSGPSWLFPSNSAEIVLREDIRAASLSGGCPIIFRRRGIC